ncbi:hypothetical protein O2K51_01315 [Apibacter raozihei]|uniref:hypothetical protein n=1 Tax=Apibacter raozihei TaxID=2500547 RepID=UPI000FE3756A|nr:hypothetical protein [Apibacter raozihei]
MYNKIKNSVLLCTIAIIIFKLLFLLTRHIQEDAFITWRVAQNILDYGVYGYNGAERISASTTHLYVLVSVIFKYIFSDNFIYPLLIFNNIVFTFGTKILSDLLLKEDKSKILFILFVNFLPPALKISTIGMEFGLLFFLYTLFLKYALVNRKNWAFVLLPLLILWTRLDAALFMLITFIFDLVKYKKINYYFILGGVLSIISIVGFNYFYFHEIINNTIVAKKLAYAKPVDGIGIRIDEMLKNTNFFSVIKIPSSISQFNFVFIITLVLSLLCLVRISKKITKQQLFVLYILYTYAVVRMLVFGFANSWFDWYYWNPQIFIFIPIIIIFVYQPTTFKTLSYLIIFFIPMASYQAVHSIATGHGEWNYNRKVGLYIDSIEPDKTKTIYLEPAGYIPYFSKLKAIDYVGLVDKRVSEEFKKGDPNVDQTILRKLKPDYILEDNKPMFKGRIDSAVSSQYKLIKEFHISSVSHSDNYILDKIYKLKPSGRDYYLYKRMAE